MTMETIQISVSASDLRTARNQQESSCDPKAVVTMLPNPGVVDVKPIILGETEIIENTSCPNWTKTVMINYDPTSDKPTYILIKIVNMAKDKMVELIDGIFDVGAILQAENNTMTKKLRHGGRIDVSAKKVMGEGHFQLEMSGVSLKNARRLGKKSIPFYQLKRKDVSQRGTDLNTVYTSKKYGKHSLNPRWDEDTIDINTLCSGEGEYPLILSLYHHKSNGKHVLIGETETSVNSLLSAKKLGGGLEIKKKGKKTGKVNIHNAEMLSDTVRKPKELVASDTLRTEICYDFIDLQCEVSLRVEPVAKASFDSSNLQCEVLLREEEKTMEPLQRLIVS
jgi:hypothetical protein